MALGPPPVSQQLQDFALPAGIYPGHLMPGCLVNSWGDLSGLELSRRFQADWDCCCFSSSTEGHIQGHESTLESPRKGARLSGLCCLQLHDPEGAPSTSEILFACLSSGGRRIPLCWVVGRISEESFGYLYFSDLTS